MAYGTRRRRRGSRVRRFLRSVFFAAIATTTCLTLAVFGTMLTTASETVNILFEPVSLLLLPGLITSILTTNLQTYLSRYGGETHDFSELEVLAGAAIFYLIAFSVYFWRRASQAARAREDARWT